MSTERKSNIVLKDREREKSQLLLWNHSEGQMYLKCSGRKQGWGLWGRDRAGRIRRRKSKHSREDRYELLTHQASRTPDTHERDQLV